MDSQPNLIDLNTDLSLEPMKQQPNSNLDHPQYVNCNLNCNGTEPISSTSSCLNGDKEDIESTYSIFGAACLPTSLSNNNKDPFDMRMYCLI